jgi:CxxC motif-containing protein
MIWTKNMICIVCPMSCHLEVIVDNQGRVQTVSGNQCARGSEYVHKELTHPSRLVTSTVMIEGALHSRLPVISTQEVPKEKVLEVIAEIKKVKVSAPIKTNECIIKNVCNLGVDIVASRTMKVYQEE